jgi:ABC-2 type transport system ATP-binding protein
MPNEYKHRIIELAERFEMRDVLFERISTFSGGMIRKLEIARCLLHRPDVLFLDEPSVGLDPVTRKSLWEYLNDVRKQHGTTVLLTTHYLDEADGADKVYIVNHGKVILEGTPDHLKHTLLDEKLIIDARDRQKLINELKNTKVQFKEEEHIVVNVGKRSAQSVIRSIETPLSLLRIERPTLEEAYIAVIQNGPTATPDVS